VAACTSAEVPLTAVQVSEKSSSKSFSLNIMWCNSV
jgi:hypothetical protein